MSTHSQVVCWWRARHPDRLQSHSCGFVGSSRSCSSSWCWRCSAGRSPPGSPAQLGIRTEDKAVPIEELTVAPPRDAVPPPRLISIDATGTLRIRTAVAELRDAVADAATTRGGATLVVRHGGGYPDDDSYRLTGTGQRFRITAASETGAVRGVYDLALAAREGRSLTARLGERVTSRLPFRMVDLGAAGVVPDPEAVEWGRRLLALLPRLRGRDPPRPTVRRPVRAAGGPRERPGVRRARVRRGLQRHRHPGIPRVRHLLRRATVTTSTPTETTTSPARRRCARRSDRSGGRSTTSACASTCAPTCWS